MSAVGRPQDLGDNGVDCKPIARPPAHGSGPTGDGAPPSPSGVGAAGLTAKEDDERSAVVLLRAKRSPGCGHRRAPARVAPSKTVGDERGA
jgi:hypothetical protein